ncbi:hypothetical protein [uncultured Roseobacter sp.]|uniref:hypothetical protein n=1 Tax=uncultured Roseobacter sp. TaxID=114847 RepID=UPI002620CD85|nr:hypothetical protein [uncultured Roseobacter sp.]
MDMQMKCQGHDAHWREDRTCSFCGSMHPDDFMEAMREAVDPEIPTYIDQTTKYYKRYVCKPDGALRKFYLWHIPTEEWAKEANELHPHVVRFSATKMERRVNETMRQMTEGDRP